MGVVQVRYGPMYGLSVGLLQPLYDGIKLLSKASTHLSFYIAVSFVAVHMSSYTVLNVYSTVHIMAVLLISFAVLDLYFIYNCLTSSSLYTILSMYRLIALVVSSDILLLTVFALHAASSSMNLYVLTLMSFVLMVVALNMSRIPYEVQEAESELIAGFVTELTSNLFLLVSYIEVAKLLVVCHVISLYYLLPYMSLIVLSVLARVAYPRIRVDSILSLTFYAMYPVLVVYFIYLV